MWRLWKWRIKLIRPSARICPVSTLACSQVLPPRVLKMQVHEHVPVCSMQCAENYAELFRQVLIAEHRTSGERGAVITYRIGDAIHKAAKDN